jgi:hypothetical protein
MSVFQQLLGIQQQPTGVLGAVMQQPQNIIAPQQQPMQAKPKFWQTPEFATTLSRLGANLMQSSTNNDNFLDSFSLAAAQTTNQGLEEQALMRQAQAQQTQQAQTGPFGGTGYQNQIMSSRYQFHIANGDAPLVAQQKAINDFYALNPVTGVNSEGQPIVTPRASLPFNIGEQVPQTAPQAMPQGDAIAQTAASLGLPEGTLLPPQSGTQPQGAMPSQGVLSAPVFSDTAMPSGGGQIGVPQMGGPKTQQALTQAAGEAQIGLQTKQAEQTMAKTSELGGDINEAYNAIQSLGTLLDASRNMFNQQGLAPETKSFIANRLGVSDPNIRRQAAATAQVGAARAESLGPLLKPLVGAGAVTEGERANVMKVVSDPNSNPDQVYAVVAPLMEKSQNRLRIMEIERANLQQGIRMPRADIAASLGVDINTGLAVGKTTEDFLPQSQGVPSGVDPNLWQFMTPEERRLWQQ